MASCSVLSISKKQNKKRKMSEIKSRMKTQIQKPRRTARQSSVYRKIETLLGEVVAATGRIPRHACGLQAVGVRAVNDTLEALSVTELAIQTASADTRMEYIAALIHEMTMVKTCLRELYAYSRKDRTEPKMDKGGVVVGGGKTVRVPEVGRVVSNGQYARILTLFGEIGREVARWREATAARMSQQDEKGPDNHDLTA